MKHRFKRGPRIARTAKERRTCDGIVFDSIAEMRRYAELKLLRDAREVVQFITQSPSFRLPGGVRYTADFLVFWADGSVTIEDVKGHRTERYIMAKKQVEELYAPLTITEIEA